MRGRVVRVYADTSVFGGVFDEEFQRPSRTFFEQVRKGRFRLVVSALVRTEIAEAPMEVREFFGEMADISELNEIADEAVDLRSAYLNAGIVGVKSIADALHVALATTLSCRAIVSWNFQHIVHFEKIPLYNGVNRAQGYAEIDIHTPQEVITYED